MACHARKLSPLVMVLSVVAAVLLPSTAARAAFPVANGKITFTHELAFDLTEIWSVNPDGTNEHRVIGTNTRFQSWSPDGSRLTYEVGYCCGQDIWVANGDGSDAKDLTNNSDYELFPSWSADSTKILFRRYTGAPYGDEVMIMDASDGSNAHTLTNNVAFDDEPVMAADGSKIAFITNRGQNANIDIYSMNPDGSKQTALTSQLSNEAEPDWSPDSTRITYDSDASGSRHIYVMNADGSHKKQLTSGAWNDGSPVFSPDGTQIAFDSDRSGDYRIWVMDADGSHQRQLSTVKGYRPDWKPFQSWDATVTVGDFGFSPTRQRVAIGSRVRWDFVGPGRDEASDGKGLGLFGSGSVPAGTGYVGFFFAAGAFAVVDPDHSNSGTIAVPARAKPPNGPSGTTFTVTWATSEPPAGYVFDVQVRAPGSSWVSLAQGVSYSSTTVTPTDPGVYAFRARLRAGGLHSGWSPTASIAVT